MKLHPVIRFVGIITVLILASIACNAPQSSPTPDLGNIVAQTQTAIAINQILTPQASLPVVTATAPSSQASPPVTPGSLSPTGVSQVSPAAQTTTALSPTSPPQVENCTNKAKFESETIPDNTQFSPNQEFMKTWTFRNVGTCTWTPEYDLVLTKGDQMGGTSPSPIGQTVRPNDIIQIYLPQKAPKDPGVYQGFWKLRSPSGKEFGLGNNSDVAFWVKINVVPGTGNTGNVVGGPQNLGAPTWIEDFEGGTNRWYLGADDDISFDIEAGKLVMTAFEPIGDQWRVAEPGFLEDFYVQASFKHGSVCTGKDGYGVIVRAPDQADNVIDSGYVFSFSCDGKYRIYRMDNGNFMGIVNWTTHPTIKPGAGQINMMGVWANEEKFQLYANGALIYELLDSTYPNGLLGLVIRSENTDNLEIFVEEVSYWDLE